MITESWINEKLLGDRVIEYDLTGYDMFVYQRETKVGGGIVIYIKNNLRAFEIKHINTCKDIESLWIDMSPGPCKSDNIRLGAFYRPPSQSRQTDLAMIDELERGVVKNTIILGDFNLPRLVRDQAHTNWETELFREHFEELFLTNYIFEPTREREVLDLILTNNEGLMGGVVLGESIGNSDHSIIRFDVICTFKVKSSRLHTTLNFAKGDYNAIRSFFSGVDWKMMLEGKNVHVMWNAFKLTITEAQNRYIPLKRRLTGRSPKPTWFNCSVQKIFNEKKKAFRHLKTSPSTNKKLQYTEARKKLKKAIRGAKRAAEIRLANECGKDLKRFFSFYKFNRHESRIGLIENNGNVYQDDYMKAEVFNEQFSSVFTDECLANIPLSKNVTTLNSKLTDICFSQDDILRHLQGLKPCKASGPDDISARILKEAAAELTAPLYTIFSKSLVTGCIPEDWKHANVVPIFKGGNKTIASNYRPVSLTSIICKILEKLIKCHILNHVEQNDILLPSQHGFIQGRSCLTNLLDFLEYTTDLLDKGGNVSVVYLDFCKAFDKVPHQRLIVSLQNHGLDGSLLKWIGSWLIGRKQRVVINGQQSKWVEVKSGVPQGTVLAPIFFIIFVNSLDSNLTSKVWKFADDLKIAREIRSNEDSEGLQSDLNKLSEWTKNWQMEFNIQKCKVLNIGAGENEYHINGNYLQNVIEEKDLGVLVTNDLKFSRHCREARKKALKMLGVLNRNVNYKSKEVVKKLYCSFVRPHLEYCAQACHSSLKKDIKSLERVQRKATKMVSGLSGMTYRDRLIQLNMFSIYYRKIRGDLIEVFKIYKGIDKLDFGKLFKINKNSTRGHNCKLTMKFSRTKLRQSFFTNRVINVWNNLPPWVIDSSSLNVFKLNVDSYFSESGAVLNTIDDT